MTDQETTPEELDQYRLAVREFIAERGPKVPFRAGTRSPETPEQQQVLRRWTAELFAAQYAGASWPEEYGGLGGQDSDKHRVVAEELARAHVPELPGAIGLASTALLDFGTDEQRAKYLPKMRSGEQIWCQLFSEPGAGSDLAGMRTSAVLDGDHYVVNGQKVWTTNGHWSDMGYLLARTNPSVPKHKGISAFMLDMRSPGVTVRPLREITGTSDFNEVFFDDVRVPAENLIGSPGQGWAIANSSLGRERSGVAATVVVLRQYWASLWSRLRRTPAGTGTLADQADVQQRMADLYARVETLAAVVEASLERNHAGRAKPQDAAINKLFFSEVYTALAYAGIELLGSTAVFNEGDPDCVDDGLWQDFFLYCRVYTVAGGSSEIMRNVIAERGLGLPR
jgi:alkylation response protein AidB-like acyl-CoA dehydrogenase